jgi:PAS domain S-box-containing protein
MDSPNLEEQSFFQILFYQNPQPMWFFDTITLKFLGVNSAAINRYGYTREEFLEMTIRDIRPLEDLKRLDTVLENLSTVHDSNEPFRHVLKNGTISHVKIISYPVTYKGYNARLVVVQDVTEIALHVERFGLIAKATHDAIWDWNLETDELWWNQTFLDLFNYNAEDVESTSESWKSRIHPDDHDRVVEYIHQVIDRGESNWSDQYRFLRANGSYADILDRGYTLFENGKAVRMLGSMMDISRQTQLQREREETETLLHTITTASPTALWMSDCNGAVIYVNQKWLDWSGTVEADNLDEGWMNIIHPDDVDRVCKAYNDAHKNRSLYQTDYRIVFKDGSVCWITASGSPRYAKDGQFIGYVGSCTDITRQKHMELQKDEFISTVSHELKTPITSIKAYEQLITRSKAIEDPKAQSFLTRMRFQITRLDALVQDLLDISRIESGKLTFTEADIEVNILLAEVINDLQLVFPTHRLIVVENHSCKIHADRNRVIQLITNLIDNAVKYSPGSNKVHVSLVCDEEFLTCSIKDFGKGISKDQQPYIFDRFYQSNDVYKSPGLGIGLYLCKEIVKRQNGAIWFNSEPGEGSTFHFKLPRHMEEA